MIEAVNSVLSNAPLTKAVVEQQSVAKSYAANPARVQEATSVAPYISLYIKVDTNFDKAVLQIRDSDTGDVVRQIPTESQLEAYRRAQTSNSIRPAQAQPAPEFVPAEPDAASIEVHLSEPVASSTPAPAPVTTSAPAPQTQTSAPTSSAPAPQTVSIDTQA